MAKDVANDLSYFLLIEENNKSHLGNIRQWNNLKIAFDTHYIWVKDFDYAQINSVDVKIIPDKTIFYAQNGKLFLQGSKLPDRNIPSLLWTPFDRALPVKLPSLNHNYFGVEQEIMIHLIPTDIEQESTAMITTIEILKKYIETAPEIRLRNLSWTILNSDKVLLSGNPILPIVGDVFWKRGNFLIPAGYDFELFVLSDLIHNTINPENDAIIVWNTDSTYFTIEKNDFQPLSLSSFRLSIQQNSF